MYISHDLIHRSIQYEEVMYHEKILLENCVRNIYKCIYGIRETFIIAKKCIPVCDNIKK